MASLSHWDDILKNLNTYSFKDMAHLANNPNSKWAKNINRHFTEEGIKGINRGEKYIKRYSTSLVIKKCQVSHEKPHYYYSL